MITAILWTFYAAASLCAAYVGWGNASDQQWRIPRLGMLWRATTALLSAALWPIVTVSAVILVLICHAQTDGESA